MRHGRIVIGITGASGAAYATRVIRLLAESGIEVHVTASSLGRRLLFDELDIRRCEPDALVGPDLADRVIVHNDNDLGATIASGSFLHDGMAIVPCSSNTLAAVSAGITNNLLQRAASVALKERRPLVLAHRESPLGRIDVPTGNIIFPYELFITPRAWAETWYNITHWTEVERGGHFAAMEQPDVLVNDLREFFRPLREGE